MGWEYFDKIYCITTKERPDRQKQAKLEFEKAGLLEFVEFIEGQKDPVDCEKGIFEAHINAIKKGLKASAKIIVVFEDDVIFRNFSQARLDNAIKFLYSSYDWNVFFFGCIVKNSRKTKYPSVLKIEYRTLAHAYAISGRFAKSIIRENWQGIPFDDLLCLHKKGMYAIYPGFAFQSNSRSDNENFLFLDKFRRICGGLERIQKMNEFFVMNRWKIIMIHLLVGLYFAVLII